mgnify:CR=1 FL=1
MINKILGVTKEIENYQLEYRCQRCDSLNMTDYLHFDMMNFQSFISRINQEYKGVPKIILCSKCKKTTIQILVSFTQEHEKNEWDLKQKAMSVTDSKVEEEIQEEYFLTDSQRLKNKITRKGSDLFK